MANSGGSAGSTTGDSAVIESISRRLRIAQRWISRFQANQTLTDDNAAAITLAVGDEYEDRRYGLNQRWINIAPRPTNKTGF